MADIERMEKELKAAEEVKALEESQMRKQVAE